MDNLKITFDATSYLAKDESVVENLKKDFIKFIEEKYGNDIKYSKLHIKHKNSNTTTPDGKFKIGNVYKLTVNKNDYSSTLIGVLVYIDEHEKGSLHLGFCPAEIKNPSYLEINMGFTDPDNKELVDGFKFSPDFIGYNWRDNNLYNYTYPSDVPVEVEFIKELDNEAFTDFYATKVVK